MTISHTDAGGHGTPVSVVLPTWAQVSPKRRQHIERVVALLMRWADEMALSDADRRDWRDAGTLHDALRDAPEAELRALARDDVNAPELLHGAAVANRLEDQGGANASVIRAVRFHTIGSADWDRTGRALYMADFLEPGRAFARRDRAFLAAQVRHDFDGVFRQVVRGRLEYSLSDGNALFPETVALWNAVR